jgi:hypothetical protein
LQLDGPRWRGGRGGGRPPPLPVDIGTRAFHATVSVDRGSDRSAGRWDRSQAVCRGRPIMRRRERLACYWATVVRPSRAWLNRAPDRACVSGRGWMGWRMRIRWGSLAVCRNRRDRSIVWCV